MVGQEEIHITDISKELQYIHEQRREKNQITACLFTLVLFSPEGRRGEYLKDLVQSILEKYPCRIIFIQGDNQSSRNFITTKVASVINHNSGELIACDQITIEASKSQYFRIPSLIYPHLVPDLPIYLLWGENPLDEKDILPSLYQWASRLIFDSECSDNPQVFCFSMLEHLASFNIEVTDVNWAMISGWQDVLAQIFDTPDKIKQLNKSKTIQISYNAYQTEFLKHSELRVMYLQAWLAAQLKWRFVEMRKNDHEILITYQNEGRPIIVSLKPQMQQDTPPGSILAIEISTIDDHLYFISRKQNLSQVIVHASSLEQCELPFTLPLPNLHRGFALIREILYHPISNHYRNMLQMLSQIVSSKPQ